MTASSSRRRPPASRAKDPAVTFRRWRRWLKSIDEDLVHLHGRRKIFRGVLEILKANPSLPQSYFVDWFAESYAHSMAVGIRRQVDRHRKALSLAKLLEDIARHPQVLSRDRYVRRFEARQRDRAHGEFDHYVGKGRRCPSRTQIERDLRKLDRTARRVKRYVDTHIAHRDLRPIRKPPTYADLHQALDEVAEVFKRYYLLIEVGTRILEPEFAHDWAAILRHRWIP